MAFVSVLFSVHPEDTGAVSAVRNTAQQIGGSFGTAIQNTIVVSSASAFLLAVRHQPFTAAVALRLYLEANVHGFDLAFRFGALMLVLAALHFFVLVNIDRRHLGQHDEVAFAH